jgi:transglutaminase-like putative cysteine protease
MMRTVWVEVCIAVGFAALSLIGPSWIPGSAMAWTLCLLARTGWLRLGAAPALILVVVGALVLAGSGFQGWMGIEDGVTSGLVLLQMQRRLVRGVSADGPHDDRVSLVLAGLMLVVTAGRSQDLGFLFLAAVWCVALPMALLPASSPRPAMGALLVGLTGHSLLSAALFMVLPRQAAPKEEVGKLTGFAPDVALGALDALLDDPTVVFRAEVVGSLPERVYWRGLALDGFDGTRWFSSTPPVAAQLKGAGGTVVARIQPSGPSDGVLFFPGPPVSVQAAGPLRADPQGAWFLAPQLSAEPYTVSVSAPHGPGAWFEADADASRWLQLPALDPEVSILARQIAGEGPEPVRLERLADWLRSEVTYTRSAGDHGPRPMEDFLLRRREGHCEFVAAGLAVLARSAGMGSRVVNGFVGGEVDPLTGEWVVRRHHAHSWTEVQVDGAWVLVDATPVADEPQVPWDVAAQAWWTGDLLSYDGARQRQSLRRWMVVADPWWWARALAVVAMVALAAWGSRMLWRRALTGGPKPAHSVVTSQHRRARRALELAGYSVPEACPPVEACARLRGDAPDDAVDAMEALAWLHYEVVLGGVPSSSVRARSRELADAVLHALAASKG